MKKLKDIIQERLHITKDTGKNPIDLDIKDENCFTQEEIDEIYDFAHSLKIKPIIITNQYVSFTNGFVFDKHIIFIHFYDEWEKIPPADKAQKIKNEEEQIITIRFAKNLMHKYYYNVLYNTRGWIYSTREGKSSCKEAIACVKNDLD